MLYQPFNISITYLYLNLLMHIIQCASQLLIHYYSWFSAVVSI